MNGITNKEILIFLEVYCQTLGHHLIRTYLIHPQHVCFHVDTPTLPHAASWLYKSPHHYNASFQNMTVIDERENSQGLAIAVLFEISNLPLSVTLKSDLNPENPVYPALSPYIAQAEPFEQEIYQQFGILPDGINLSSNQEEVQLKTSTPSPQQRIPNPSKEFLL